MRSHFALILPLSCLAMTAVSCGGAERGVSRVELGAAAEARESDCPVAMRPSWPEAAGTRPLAELTVHCATAPDPSVTRARCQETLRQAACARGADVAYAMRYHPEVGGLRLEAKVGLGPQPRAQAEGCTPACSPGYECVGGFCVEVCEPRCEAGFTCEAGECQPLCRPACAEGETCSAERVCVEASDDEASESADMGEATADATEEGSEATEASEGADGAEGERAQTAERSGESDESNTPAANAESPDPAAPAPDEQAANATGSSPPQAEATGGADRAPTG